MMVLLFVQNVNRGNLFLSLEKEMIEKSQLLIITECESKRSKNLLSEAKAKGIPVKIIR